MKVSQVAAAAGLPDVSRETEERLTSYVHELEKWTKKINLIGNTNTYDVWSRHIVDSVQIWPHRHQGTRHWVDLGSGGGLPGIPIAILAAEFSPQLKITLVEADQRKSVFLRHIAGMLDLPIEVQTERIEVCSPLSADTVSARALAPLPKLLDLAARHAAQNATLLLLKGRNADAELTEARKFWTFDLTRIPSVTDPEAVLLKIGALRRV